jgi:prepilin-type N-terminal cleavage/methylation domain-containing protein
MKHSKGFSLIELLLVVVVILIIAAIAIPNFLHARLRANEASAVSSVRVIITAAEAYSTTYSNLGYPALLTNLGGAEPCTTSPMSACLIEDFLAQGTKEGYVFVWTGDGNVPSVAFILTATPQFVGSSGQRMFCTDPTSQIHFEPSGAGCTTASQVLN